jgi:hypothetical protein
MRKLASVEDFAVARAGGIERAARLKAHFRPVAGDGTAAARPG